MQDRIRQYLGNLQTGYRLEEIKTDPNPDLLYHQILSPNPFRVAVFLDARNASTFPYRIKLPSGMVIFYYPNIASQLELDWIRNPHLIYQEFGLEDSNGGYVQGFQIVKS